MRFDISRPSPPLTGIVERLWRVESADRTPETICPDGRPELVIHLGDAMAHQPRFLVVGQMTAPLTVTPSGRVAMVGARLTPAGLYRLSRVPQERLTDGVVSLEDLWPQWTRRTAECVAAERTPEGQLAAFDHALQTLLPACAPVDASLDAVLQACRRSLGNVSITVLADAAGLSRRQLERRFRERVGVPPRLFARIVRFQAAFGAVGCESAADIAARCGYADQAHLAHEVRRFAGQTPRALATAEGLTTFFRQ